jgi:hypothetical protein
MRISERLIGKSQACRSMNHGHRPNFRGCTAIGVFPQLVVELWKPAQVQAVVAAAAGGPLTASGTGAPGVSKSRLESQPGKPACRHCATLNYTVVLRPLHLTRRYPHQHSTDGATSGSADLLTAPAADALCAGASQLDPGKPVKSCCTRHHPWLTCKTHDCSHTAAKCDRSL